MENKVLILTNDLSHEGGVVNYYRIWFENVEWIKENLGIEIHHFTIGTRSRFFYNTSFSRFLYPLFFIYDILRLMYTLYRGKYRYVQLNPSFDFIPVMRDTIFKIVATTFNVQVIVFFRGWKDKYELVVYKSRIHRYILGIILNDTDVIVLSERFKNALFNLNFTVDRTIVTTTMVNTQDFSSLAGSQKNSKGFVFLGRLQPNKGIEELLKAFLKFVEIYQEYDLFIIGHEYRKGYKKKLEELVDSHPSIHFLGRLDGQEKYKVLMSNSYYILPSYTEGCPNSLLEAVECGSFPIVTNVGCMPDVVNSIGAGIVIPNSSEKFIYKALIQATSMSSNDITLKPRFIYDYKSVLLRIKNLYQS